MRMKLLTRIVLVTLLFVVSVGAGCSTTNNISKTNEIQQVKDTSPIKVGFIGPLSGDVANIGQNMRAAVEVARDEINKNGGIQGRMIETIFEDGQCGAKEAANAANKLVNVDKVIAFMTTCSDETLAAAPIAQENKTIILSPASTNPKVTDAGDYVFRIIPSDLFQGKFVADYVYNTLNKKNIAILYNADKDWSTGVKEVFKKQFLSLGGIIVAEESTATTDRDLKTQIAKIKQSNPELIYFPSFVESGLVGIKQIREAGITTPIFGGDVWDDATMPQKLGTVADGVKFTRIANEKSPQSFVDAMRSITGTDEINSYAPRSYDALQMLGFVIDKVGTDTEKIRQELYKIQNYKGIADTYSFDTNGDMSSANYEIKEFMNDAIVDAR